MALIIYDILFVLFFIHTKNINRKILTPFTLLFSPFFILFNLNNLLVSNIYNFNLISTQSILFYLVIMILLFGIEQLFFQKNKMKIGKTITKTDYSVNITNFAFLIGLVAYIISFLINYRQHGIQGMKGQNNGILGHMSNLAIIFSPNFLRINYFLKKRKMSLVLVIIHFLLSALFGGKYVIVINICYILFFFILQKKITIKKIFKYAICLGVFAILLFIILYALIPYITGSYGENKNIATYLSFAISHLFRYLLSPVIANNYSLFNPQINTEIPFTVFINLAKAFTGNSNYVSPIYEFVFPYTNFEYVNVSGLIGESFYCLGGWGIFYLMFVFIIFEYFFFQYHYKGKYKMTTSYLSAVFLLCFFCNFFTVSGVMLPLITIIILEFSYQNFYLGVKL